VDGKMNGQGTYVYSDGDKYEGQWKDDKRHVKGTVTYRGQDGNVVEKYEGDWYEGKMHGFGRYVYADGGVYEGQWVDGKMCGKGTYVFPNGNKYEGETRHQTALKYIQRAEAPHPEDSVGRADVQPKERIPDPAHRCCICRRRLVFLPSLFY
jgi:hypothetical protein